MMAPVARFSFLALAYNHEDYIVEHLESIKFLVETYAVDFVCDLIINDDCSRDGTVFLIDAWLDSNSGLFNSVVKLYNDKNLGTCASVANMLKCVRSSYLKITACDDVYSFENIFKYGVLDEDVSILGGYPLSLVDGVLSERKMDTYGILASNVIYKRKPALDRFKYLSNSNAPNIFYNSRFLFSNSVIGHLRVFDVVEDWPLQIAISEQFPEMIYQQIDKVFVYYRRTAGSTFLVAGDRFYNDKCKAYQYLINIANGLLERFFLRSRYYCFRSGNKFLNVFLNACFYKFLFDLSLRVPVFFYKLSRVDLRLFEHRSHYLMLKSRANIFNSFL